MKNTGGRGAWSLSFASLWILVCASAQAEEPGIISGQYDTWVSVGSEHWRADERFAGPFGADLNFSGFASDRGAPPARQLRPGDRVPIKLDVPGARFRSDALWLKVRAKPWPRVLLAVAMPVYQRAQFTQAGSEAITVGTGDVYTTAGVQLTDEDRPVGTSLYVHVKVPTTQVEFEDFTVALSEGQVDVAMELSTSFWVAPWLRLTTGLLFRGRTEKKARVGAAIARVKPGNETEIQLELAGPLHELLWLKTSYLGMWAGAAQDRSIANDFRALEQRQIHWWRAGIYYRFGGHLGEVPVLRNLAIDAGFRFPMAGQDFLRGPGWNVALAWGGNWQTTP